MQADFPVRVSAHRFAVRDGLLVNLSVSGALIEVDLDARVLSRVQIFFPLPAYPRHEVPVVEAYVARRHRHGIGVEWCDFAPRTVRDLLRDTLHRPNVLNERSRGAEFEVRNRRDT